MENRDTEIKKRVAAYMGRCSVCHRQYDETDVEVRSRENDNWMMLVQCPDCRGQQVVAARFSDKAYGEDVREQLIGFAQREVRSSTSTPVPIQLEGSSDLPPVDVDDISEMHAFLESFDGNFDDLFASDRSAEDAS